MTPEEYDDILFDHNNWRFSARIVGAIEIALLLLIAYDQLGAAIIHLSPSMLVKSLNGQYFLTIGLTLIFSGLVIAYWKEGLGGAICIIMYILFFINAWDFHFSFILGMSLGVLPGVLYFTYWLKVYLDVKKAERQSTKNLEYPGKESGEIKGS